MTVVDIQNLPHKSRMDVQNTNDVEQEICAVSYVSILSKTGSIWLRFMFIVSAKIDLNLKRLFAQFRAYFIALAFLQFIFKERK